MPISEMPAARRERLALLAGVQGAFGALLTPSAPAIIVAALPKSGRCAEFSPQPPSAAPHQLRGPRRRWVPCQVARSM